MRCLAAKLQITEGITIITYKEIRYVLSFEAAYLVKERIGERANGEVIHYLLVLPHQDYFSNTYRPLSFRISEALFKEITAESDIEYDPEKDIYCMKPYEGRLKK